MAAVAAASTEYGSAEIVATSEVVSVSAWKEPARTTRLLLSLSAGTVIRHASFRGHPRP
jgi:hypothetical protein